MSTKDTIVKWYRALQFPTRYDREFYEALETIEVPKHLTVDAYDIHESNGKRNLLSFLYFCEEVEQEYARRGIPHEILMDTLSDLRRWTIVWSELKGELSFNELRWMKSHMRCRLFQLGSLHFAMAPTDTSIPEYAIAEGEPVIEVHIPAGTDLSDEACTRSFAEAKTFFASYFPDYTYRFFTCHSWLLDSTLKQFLKPESNIIGFQNRFSVVKTRPSISIIRFLFRWDMTLETLPQAVPATRFAEQVKQHLLSGGEFHVALGLIERGSI